MRDYSLADRRKVRKNDADPTPLFGLTPDVSPLCLGANAFFCIPRFVAAATRRTRRFSGGDPYRRVLFTARTNLALPGGEIIHDPLDGIDPASLLAKLTPDRYFPEDWSIWLENKSRLKLDPQWR